MRTSLGTTRVGDWRADLSLLLTRLVVGVVLIAHGSQKLFGAFGGGGMAGT